MFDTHTMKRRFAPLCALALCTSGSVAAWSAVAFPVMSVGAALSVDVSRLQALDTELQSAADALSRAGAAELDQSVDSIARARRAVAELVKNDSRIGGRADIDVAEVRFLSELPTPRWEEDTDSVRTERAAEARYVEVRITPKTVGTIFPVSLSGRFSDATLSARSIAGMQGGKLCDAAPVFICNPFEADETTTIQQAAQTKSFQRRQIEFVQGAQSNSTSKGGGKNQNKGKGTGGSSGGGNTAQYAPGNFGWLDPFGANSGAAVLRDAIGMDVSDVCVSQSEGVYLRPGQIASMRHAVNTRFDIYDGPYKSAKNDIRFAPAENVVKGWAINEDSNACEQQPNSHALGLPRDSASDAALGDRIGNGDWDFTRYMQVNHPGFNRITIEGVTYRYKSRKGHFVPKTPPSRYAMYRWEIDNNCVPGSLTYGRSAGTPEEGLPQCHSHGASQTAEDRRVIKVAVLNCAAIEASDEKFHGRTGALPVEAFVRVFLTEPMGNDQTLRGEVIGLIDPAADPDARERVALAR